MATDKRWMATQVTWYGGELTKRLTTMMVGRLHKVGTLLVGQMKKNLSGSSPSKPGGYPGLSSGALQNSVYYEVDPAAMRVKVASNSPYALFLEYGTSGGKVIVAAPGRVFSWIDPATKERVFSRRIKLGSIRRRSFLRRTTYENYAKISKLLTETSAGGRIYAGEKQQVGGGKGGYGVKKGG
jgi:hypothetical protein